MLIFTRGIKSKSSKNPTRFISIISFVLFMENKTKNGQPLDIKEVYPFGAEGRNRTGTRFNPRRILSQT